MKHLPFASLPLLTMLAVGHAQPASAASLVNLGHLAGAQCRATGVNDQGIVAGVCIPGNSTGAPVAWMTTAANHNQRSLSGLSAGVACDVFGIANSGSVIGSCLDQMGVPFAVTWAGPSVVPLKLAPLSGILGIDVQVRTTPKAFNQAGFVAGQSVAFDGSTTAAIWQPNTGVALLVSSSSDNCEVAAINDDPSGGLPNVLLNCPNPAGTTTAKVATPTGLLRTYISNPLVVPAGSAYCIAKGINGASQVVGSCIYPSSPFSQTAIWATPTASPSVLTLPGFAGDVIGKRNEGRFINDAGHVVFSYQTDTGGDGVGYLDLTSMPVFVPSLDPGASISAVGFGNNDRIVVVGDNASGNKQAAVFDPSSPTVLSPIAQLPGGTNTVLKSVSRSGSYTVGTAQDAAHVDNAVLSTLP